MRRPRAGLGAILRPFARALIVPETHTRIFDARLQATMYAVFHRDWRCRWGHRLLTPVIVLGMLILAASLSRAHPLPAVVLLGALLVALWVRLDAAATLLAAPALVGLAVLALWLVHQVDDGVALGSALVVGGAIGQAGTHLFEPVPPPLSGSDGFVSGPVLLRRHGVKGLAAALVLWLAFYWVLEVWAATRVFVLQWQQVTFAFGARARLARAIRLEAERFHAAPAAWKASDG
jgi:uncharacterized membrane protein YGL010W